LQNRLAGFLASSARQITSVFMIFLGTVLAANASTGPCGGTALAAEPTPAIFIAILGLELILCSYFPVKKLRSESSFRAIVYLFLIMWSLSLLAPALSLAFSGIPRSSQDMSDSIFSLLRGAVAVVNLAVFYRWAGIKNLITST
jgi:hypothetical protein